LCERSHFEELGIDGRTILNRSKEMDVRMWYGFVWLHIFIGYSRMQRNVNNI
jgi:hypothetical protein